MKKSEKINLKIFLLLMIACSTYCNYYKQKFNTYVKEEIADYKEYLTNYKKDIDMVKSLYDSQMKMIQDYKNKNSSGAFYLEVRLDYFHEGIFPDSNLTYNILLENFQNVTKDYKESNIMSNKTIKGLQEEMKIRKKIGLFDLNRLVNNFFNLNKTKQNLINLQKILDLNDNNTALSKKLFT